MPIKDEITEISPHMRTIYVLPSNISAMGGGVVTFYVILVNNYL